jgi:hypothetical protein
MAGFLLHKVKSVQVGYSNEETYLDSKSGSSDCLIVSILPAVKYGKCYYQSLERAIISALAGSSNFGRQCRWPRWHLHNLKCWQNSAFGWKCSFESRIPSITVITDASLQGWGAIWDNQEIFSPWESDTEDCIDELELLTVLYAVQCWSLEWAPGSNIQLWCDNQVAVAYIRNMDGLVDRLDRIAKQIWQKLECRDLFMIASYIHTKENPADALTRGVSSKKQLLDCEVQLNPQLLDCEVQLNTSVFEWLIDQVPVKPEIDWFASCENAQLPWFFAWRSDSEAEGVDAFSFDWGANVGYMFPPFVLIPRILSKIVTDKAVVLFVHPDWPGALWAPDLRRLEKQSIPLPVSADLLRYPNHPNLRHPMRDLRLTASWLDEGSLT